MKRRKERKNTHKRKGRKKERHTTRTKKKKEELKQLFSKGCFHSFVPMLFWMVSAVFEFFSLFQYRVQVFSIVIIFAIVCIFYGFYFLNDFSAYVFRICSSLVFQRFPNAFLKLSFSVVVQMCGEFLNVLKSFHSFQWLIQHLPMCSFRWSFPCVQLLFPLFLNGSVNDFQCLLHCFFHCFSIVYMLASFWNAFNLPPFSRFCLFSTIDLNCVLQLVSSVFALF